MIIPIIFAILSVLAVASALVVVFHPNPVYNVLALIVTFFCIAGHYFLLNSQFLAIVHIIVYAGAIMVLFLYVMMMLNLNVESEPIKPLFSKIAAVVAGGLFMIVMVAGLSGAEKMTTTSIVSDNLGLINNLGTVLYTKYMLPFEVSSILFLAGMVGAVMLGKKDEA